MNRNKIFKSCDNFSVNKKRVIQVLKDVRDLIFPGYFNTLCSEAENANIFLHERAFNALRMEIEKINKINEYNLDSKKIAKDFFSNLDNIIEDLRLDLKFAFESDPAAIDDNEIIISYPGFFAIVVYRIANILYKLGVPYIPRIMSEYAHSKTGIDIHPGASIGNSFFIDHGTGVVIGETAVIGNRVKIYQNVTLGALSLGRGQLLKGTKRHPTIKDNVTIYSGASILGGDTVINNNVIIGANAFITASVEENTIAILKSQDIEFVKKMNKKSTV